jgi:hypothetical protein
MTFDQAQCPLHGDLVPGDFVMLAVSDDGCGMDKETKDNIFEPFYTTKSLHEGTGLGLATVYGILKQNNGFVNVYTELGKGTTFKLYFPRFQAEEKPTKSKRLNEAPVSQGETVLLVEDEPAILVLYRNMLEMLGYNVLAAGSPVDAIRLAEENAGSIQLLVTDVVMPEMTGRDLSARLSAGCPELRTLFSCPAIRQT